MLPQILLAREVHNSGHAVGGTFRNFDVADGAIFKELKRFFMNYAKQHFLEFIGSATLAAKIQNSTRWS